MDLLDIRIFCEMGFKYHPPGGMADRRPSISGIAKALELDPRTVRARMNRLEQEGFTKYYQAVPNYRVLGYSCTTYVVYFTDMAAKKEAVRKIQLLDEIVRVDENFYSIVFSVLYKTNQDLEKKLALVKELATAAGSRPLKLYDLALPDPRLKMSQTDWRIIKSLRYNALKPSKEVAGELGLTVPTVNSRLGRLIRSRALYVIPIFSAQQVSQLILYALVFFIDESANRERVVQEIHATFGERSYNRIVNPSGAVVFLMFATKTGQPEEDYMRAKALDGVSDAMLDLIGQTHDCSHYIDRLVDWTIAAMEKEAPTAAS
jgi:DNA-binding Lrp family transcriptional regulator